MSNDESRKQSSASVLLAGGAPGPAVRGQESGVRGQGSEPSSAFRPPPSELYPVLTKFAEWLDNYGEVSWDYQSFFAGPIGGRAKALYYKNRSIGTVAVAPMIFCEAIFPAGRRLFHRPMRFPIADAHYAMGFAFLYGLTSDPRHLQRATHFLDELVASRCSDFKEYCWGYPFDWVTQGGIIKQGTPLITTTPYVYEAFLQMYSLEARDEWKEILASIARHTAYDIKDLKTSERASSSSYTPFGEYYVINPSAYRAFLLTSASLLFQNEDYLRIAERNLNFVLENQNADGSWFYAVDGVRDFVDHFHTCFVMKALAKVVGGGAEGTGDRGQGSGVRGQGSALGGELAARTDEALRRGVNYYLAHLFTEDGFPKPFARAPRLTVYKRELYDWAECINLCLLLRDRFPELDAKLHHVVGGILRDWIKPDGSFRSRRLHFGWDNVPMHRWAQAQMFRALAAYAASARNICGGRMAEDGGQTDQ